ncbi:TetR/AcrR family transcriptional regulator C-terminal domain-containing protein [Nesterenkonia sphaerica]|uniref:TetR family transcriptional regulator n=1 Tax=Nesterenkonia sphaerica TaxID=1804988 RepID=A0A5R8ZWN3_9MICC|nr:TetR/AcrR family transcriptional regulator C-terminal domain-containing protein [Nesterenkonia sphaerica]TLP70690.1 TetR family transcriptional regulator [Nesterenkonia sphaerica]
MSYWEHRKPVRRSRAVDVDQVAEEAACVLDEGGIRALTIRAVAQRLEVAASSLYSRVSSLDDLYDLALDRALSTDGGVQDAMNDAGLHELMMSFYRHLVAHPWACQVIAMRAPRGPNYLLLSERMCSLLVERGAGDPLGKAYILSNFVIGSATTTPMARNEWAAPIDAGVAPVYAKLHAVHDVDPETLVSDGIQALLSA